MRLALLQAPSPAADDEAAFATLAAALNAAGAMGAATLTAPEIYLPGYNQPDIPARAQPRGGPWHQRLSSLCRAAGCGIVIGYAERAGERIYNSAIAIDAAGREIAHYRKLQLYGPRENAIYTVGDAYTLFNLHGRTAALLICYDVEFAPHIAALADRGASLILCPTANMLPYTHVARVTVPAMAVNHAVTIAYANFCGSEGDLDYAGGSVIAGPDGEILARAGAHPALLVVDLPAAYDPARLSTQARDLRSL